MICFSPVEKNQVWSNVAGAAALRGNVDLLKFILFEANQSQKQTFIDFKAEEKLDETQSLIKPMKQEMTDYTPLMFAILS